MKKLQNAPLRWGPCEAHCCPRIDEPFRSYISYAAKKTCPETLGDTIDDTTVVLAIAVTASFSTGQVWSVITSDKNEFCHPGLCIWCLVIVTLGDVLLQRKVPLTFLENAHEAPASRQVGTQKSSVSSFLKKTPCRKALRDFGGFFDRGRNEQNKKRWQRFEAGTRTPSYCMHSTSRGCHEIHDDFSSRRLNTRPTWGDLFTYITIGDTTNCQVWMVFCMVIWPYRASWNIHWVWSCQSAVLLWHAAGIAQILRWNNQRTKGPALVIHPGIQTSSHNKMVFHCVKDRSFVWKSSNKC